MVGGCDMKKNSDGYTVTMIFSSSEYERLCERAGELGLSPVAFLRLAAWAYMIRSPRRLVR